MTARCRARAVALSRSVRAAREADRPAAASHSFTALVEHHDLRVAGEAQVLEPVVADENVDLGVRLQERAARGGAIAADEHRHLRATTQQQRLVACQSGGRVGLDREHAVVTSPVTAGNDAGPESAAFQQPDDRSHRRGLACTADDEIADDDDRNGQSLGAQPAQSVETAPQTDQRAEDERNGQQEEGDAAAIAPCALQAFRDRRHGRRRPDELSGTGRRGCSGWRR